MQSCLYIKVRATGLAFRWH